MYFAWRQDIQRNDIPHCGLIATLGTILCWVSHFFIALQCSVIMQSVTFLDFYAECRLAESHRAVFAFHVKVSKLFLRKNNK